MKSASSNSAEKTGVLRLALAQQDFLVGDVEGNAERVLANCARARDELGADVVAFPELALTGYPPEDLLLRADLHMRVLRALEFLKQRIKGVVAVIGHPQHGVGGLYNAASVIADGKTLATYRKQYLPNYSVFDEKRYFVAGEEPCVVDIGGVAVGITVCEDAWNPGPLSQSAKSGAQFIININASPFHLNKGHEREEVIAERIRSAHVPVVYVNLVGGQDELVFDGESFVMDQDGVVTHRFPPFEEGLYTVDIRVDDNGARPAPAAAVSAPLTREESAYRALVLGVSDYVNKNRFSGAVIGLSGGIDSALTLAISVDALGAERVEAVMMPSRYTAKMSVEDAAQEARLLGVEHRVIPIEPAYQAFLGSLAEEFANMPTDTTEENIQARCRGVILMAISNKKQKIVLTTGNKSEMAVGYATLYGDMAGGFGVLKDVPKTLVYRLAEYRNRVTPVIPQRVIDRPPSAELAADQKDTDSLPPYDVLDPILEMYVEQDKSEADIAAAGFDAAVVRRVVTLVNRNEYKRRQAPPGVRITRRAFGRDRRYPITTGTGLTEW